MSESIGYIATWARTSTAEEQRTVLEAHAETIVSEGAINYATSRIELKKALEQLRPGGALYVHTPAVLAMTLQSLMRVINWTLDRQSSLVFIEPSVTFSAATTNSACDAARLFDEHDRVASGFRRRSEKARPTGRPPKLTKDDWPAIRTLLEAKATLWEIASQFQVSRATLYNFIKLHRGVDCLGAERAPKSRGEHPAMPSFRV
jgi:DNA invertase Pin-like site-specific DNA recombinase